MSKLSLFSHSRDKRGISNVAFLRSRFSQPLIVTFRLVRLPRGVSSKAVMIEQSGEPVVKHFSKGGLESTTIQFSFKGNDRLDGSLIDSESSFEGQILCSLSVLFSQPQISSTVAGSITSFSIFIGFAIFLYMTSSSLLGSG